MKDFGSSKKSDMKAPKGLAGNFPAANVRKADRLHGSGNKPSQTRPGNHL